MSIFFSSLDHWWCDSSLLCFVRKLYRFAVQWPLRAFVITKTKNAPVQFLSSTSIRRLFDSFSAENEFGCISEEDASMGNLCIWESDELLLLMD